VAVVGGREALDDLHEPGPDRLGEQGLHPLGRIRIQDHPLGAPGQRLSGDRHLCFLQTEHELPALFAVAAGIVERPRPEQPGGLVFAHPDRRRLGQRPLPDYLQRVLQHLLDAAGNLLLVFFELAGMVATLIQLGMLLETVEPAEEAVEEAVDAVPAGAALVVVGPEIVHEVPHRLMPVVPPALTVHRLCFAVGVAVQFHEVVGEAVVGVMENRQLRVVGGVVQESTVDLGAEGSRAWNTKRPFLNSRGDV